MAWILHEKEYAACLELPAAKRYEYTIKKIADNGGAGSLQNAQGWLQQTTLDNS
jgi:hypothetical protein